MEEKVTSGGDLEENIQTNVLYTKKKKIFSKKEFKTIRLSVEEIKGAIIICFPLSIILPF
jgi:hypothetical protein